MLFERLAKLDDLPNLPTEIAAVAVCRSSILQIGTNRTLVEHLFQSFFGSGINGNRYIQKKLCDSKFVIRINKLDTIIHYT
jgi:hypothetical protein